MKIIEYPLFHDPVEITHALISVASQENCDGPEYDLMMEAADWIRKLESERWVIFALFQLLKEQGIQPSSTELIVASQRAKLDMEVK
jgi:hypothetical protein